MSAQCLIAEYSSLADARVGLKVLDKFDFKADAVSLVSKAEESEMADVDQRQRTDEEEAQQAVRSAGVGSLIGGSIATEPTNLNRRTARPGEEEVTHPLPPRRKKLIGEFPGQLPERLLTPRG